MMSLLDSLHCEENHQREVDNNNNNNNIHHQYKLLPEDLFCEHQQLSTLISKESDEHLHNNGSCISHRLDAVEWILGAVSRYAFTALTAVMAVNYLDRFVDRFEELETEKKQWMTQLAAVSCLSLAAKVEETHVPLLLDLQIDGSKYVFEAKTIQKMEILILSTLEWKMNPVTPLSFLDYVTRRLGLKSYLSSEFIKRCECLLLSFLPNGRFRCYLPSVIAAATMLHVINSVESCICTEFQSQLQGILGINKEAMDECWKEIQKVTCSRHACPRKRKFGSVPGSPDDVVGLSFSSDESWPESGAKKSRNGAV